jgi:N-acetylglucosamine-6-phosphate deacetylase
VSILFHSARKLDARGQVDDFWMLVEADTIAAVGSGPSHPPANSSVDVRGGWLLPGFIDLHGHGGGGHSYEDGPDDLVAALATHRAHGTTRSLVSLVANPIPLLREQLAIVADLAAVDPLVLGSHLEGPFLSTAHRGAQNPAFLLEPEPEEVETLITAARGTLRQLTLAPELPGAFEAIDVLVEAGIVVGIGHTAADQATTRAAFDRGARLLTHAFNGMPGIHHRDPGPVAAAFDDDRVTLELIMDGKHVHPSVVHLAFTAAPGRIALVTDAMAAAGSSDGDYALGSLNVTVRDGLAMLRGTTTIAGSTVTQDSALRQAIRDVGIAPADAVAALTHTPARALGIDHRHGMLATGYVADAVLLDHHWHVTGVWANGAELSAH